SPVKPAGPASASRGRFLALTEGGGSRSFPSHGPTQDLVVVLASKPKQAGCEGLAHTPRKPLEQGFGGPRWSVSWTSIPPVETPRSAGARHGRAKRPPVAGAAAATAANTNHGGARRPQSNGDSTGMSTVRLEAVKMDTVKDIPLQPASLDIWDKKYRLKTKAGDAVDEDIDGTWRRVARALAEAEPTEELRRYWEERFAWALRRGAIPAGRITSNAGALEHKPATSTINCTVSGTIEDSMDGILQKVHEAGLTLKAGCGIGYEFSTLRPRGAFVAGAGAYTSGPMSFMDIYDKMCFTVSSAGGRRGAQMGTFDVSHPDVKDFIRAKREDGRLRQFNLSLLITDGFMEAVRDDADWPLVFPVNVKEKGDVDLDDPAQVVWREWPTHRHYITREDGLVA